MIDIVARAPDGASGAHDVEAATGFRTLLAVYAFAVSAAYGAADVVARPDRVAPVVDAMAVAPFPTQYAGLRIFYGGAVRELCVVAVADAPSGMGGVPRVRKGGTTYAVYLVETTDPLATPLRVATTAGTKAVRVKT